MESAEEVTPVALDWINRNAADDNWFLQLNYWDPHPPYRAPEEFGNPLWHYAVTGSAIEEMLKKYMKPEDNFAGAVLSSGSAGTLGSGYYLKTIFPNSKILDQETIWAH